MTASASFSSAAERPELPRVELVGAGRLPPLAEAFLRGRDLDLLAPVKLLAAGSLPTGDCAAAAPDRRQLARALGEANQGYGHPAAAELAAQLADRSTQVVITGQQPGLFGGPLYALSKAVAAELWAERLRATGRPAVALFWIATEDHDFRETSEAVFLAADGPVGFTLGEDQEPLTPVGSRKLGSGVEEILARLRATVPGERFGSWLDELAGIYTPESRFGDAFARLMVRVMGERCPLLVDAQLAALKSAQRPWLRRIVEQRHALSQAFADRDQQIGAKGHALQVRPQSGASPLFLVQNGQRRRIEWRGQDRVRLRGDNDLDEGIEWLLEVLEGEPERISAGVRARSAIQDAVFGTCVQVLGPAELSYLPQVAPLFELLDIPAPWAVLRPQAVVLDERQRAKLVDSGVAFDQLLDPTVELDSLLARTEDTEFLTGVAADLEGLLQRLRDPALALDASLEGPWGKTRDQMQRALRAFAGRVEAAAARRDATSRARVEALRALCLPLGKPQERTIAVAHFPGKYGQRFVEVMFEQLGLEPTTLHVISP